MRMVSDPDVKLIKTSLFPEESQIELSYFFKKPRTAIPKLIKPITSNA